LSEETPNSGGQLSPDGYWWWDGQQWVSTISPDGRWRWNGTTWVVNEAVSRAIGPVRYEPTPDTRRVQLAVIAYLVLSAVVGVIVAPATMSDAINRSLQQSAATNPGFDPTVLQGFMETFVVIGIVFVVLWAGFLAIGTWLRWRWMYYLVMILGFLGSFNLITQTLALFRVSAYAFIPPWDAVLNIIASLIYLGIAIWMLMLWRRYRTAWACHVVPA
jgi:hypothetical protein